MRSCRGCKHTSAFGVGSVWMNIVRRVMVADGERAPWLQGCARGRCCAGETVIGDDFWCRHLVAMRGACERMDGVARERLCSAARGIFIEAIDLSVGVGDVKKTLKVHNGNV